MSTGSGTLPEVRLVRSAPGAAVTWREDEAADAVIAHTAGSLRVLGGPGTGKTSVLARAAAARLNDGADADEVLLLTFTRRGAATLRDAVVRATTVALRQVPVRSFESYAWAVLDRAARRREEWSAPRLITGPEQDAIIRELLTGSLEGVGVTRWPDELRAALPTTGFAQEVRDALMRCAERGVSAGQLHRWAGEHDREVWAALGTFLTEYSGVTAMRLEDSYDPSELVRAVVDLWQAEPDELYREQQRISHLYVDEAQELDPAKRDLLQLLAEGTGSLVVAGDPDQSVFGFRGADRRALMDFAADRDLSLLTGYRATPALADVVRGWSSSLGASYPQHTKVPADALDPLVVLSAASEAREAADVAAVLRERHLIDGVPWNEMCVVVRSVGRSLPVIRRAFVAAGVPLDGDLDEPAVGRSPAVRSLLDIVRLSQDPLPDGALVEDVLRSQYFRFDALMMRRLRKTLRTAELTAGGVRSSTKLLIEAVAGRLEVPPHPEAAGLRELVRILTLLRELAEADAGGEELLAAAWQASGAQQRWRAEALLGGLRGADADQRLDSVIAAFDIASSLSSRLREASFATIAEQIERQELPADRLSRGARRDESVAVLSANNAKGRQWEVVAVLGVQDGAWPNLVPRNTLLQTEDLVDLSAGIDPRTIDRRAQLLQDERRLFYVALSRARRQLVVSAACGPGQRPSRFFTELVETSGVEVNAHRTATPARRSLSMLDHIATLRSCLLDPYAAAEDQDAALVALRRLADAGVTGAAPADWYAVRDVSCEAPIVAADDEVRISPSSATTFMDCGLKWFLQRIGSMRHTVNLAVGTLVHAAFEAAGDARGRSTAELFTTMKALLDERWGDLDFDAPWEQRQWYAKALQMIDVLAGWLAGRDYDWVGSEVEFDVLIGRARIRGKVDRLERDPATGRLFTIDLKTGSVPSKAESARNPQLAMYQLAAEHGGYRQGQGSAGAALLGVKNVKNPSLRSQPPVTEDAEPQWANELLDELVDGMSASTFQARTGPGCRTCDFVAICPAIRVLEEDDR